MEEIPWWTSSQNFYLSDKVENTYSLRSAKQLLDLPNLVRVKFMKDGNQGGEYFRFFGFFKDDPQRYFQIFGTWDLSTSFFNCEVGHYFSATSTLWKVVGSELNGFILELERL